VGHVVEWPGVQPGETEVALSTAGASTRPGSVRGHPRRLLRGLGRWLAERRIVLASGLAASLPIIVSTIEVVATGWVPFGDDALIATSSFDVLTSDSPLLGPWSSGYSAITGEPTFHPGPLLFWLLAIPIRLPWTGAPEVAVGLINVLSVLGVVGLAGRRAGRPFMFAVAIAIPLMLASLPAEAYSDIWNPSAPLLPFTLLIFLAWSLACGEYRLLPVTVLAASFVVQCHLGFLVPVLVALGVGLGGLVVSRRWAVRPRSGGSRRGPAGERRSMLRWVVAAMLVGLLCWTTPLIDQAVNRPGNVVLVARAATADEPRVGAERGWRALVHTVGVVPWWLRDPQVPVERLIDLVTSPSAVATGSTVLILGALAAMTLLGARRRQMDTMAAGALGLGLSLALALVTASTPARSIDTLGYSLRWASPVGMWVWLTLGWWLIAQLRWARRDALVLRPALAALRGRSVSAIAGVAAVAGVATVVAVSGELTDEPFDEMATVSDRLGAAVARDRPVQIQVTSTADATFMALGFGSGITYSLRREGRVVRAPDYVDYLGPEYGVDRPGEQIVRVDVDRPRPRRGRPVARLRVPDYPPPGDPLAPKNPPRRAVVVTLVPATGGR
jgi:hypothetical protein